MNISNLSSHLINPDRLAALHAVALLDTPVEESFDRLTRLVAYILQAPVALVSLVDADRQFFKSCFGLSEPWSSRRETPLSHSFCQHNRTAGQPLIIEDARVHPLFKDNLAIRDLNVVAYLGIPLVTPDGYILGSFCVIDIKPRCWTEKDVEVIEDLAVSVMTEIQLRTEMAARHKSEKERDRLREENARLHVEIGARMQAEVALRKSEEELRKSEGRLRALIQTIPDLVWLKDRDGTYLSCNKIFQRFFAAKGQDIVGKTDYDLVDRELADFFRKHDQKAIAAGKPSSNEEWVTCLEDGHQALLETIKTPIYEDKGSLLGVLGIGRDITERRRNEEALQYYIFLMKEMGKAAKIGGWEFDVATGKETWTEEVACIHEVDPREPNHAEIGMRSYSDASKGKITKAMQCAVESGAPYVLELELVTAKGNHKWVKTICYPVIENDKVVKLRGSFQDVTERKKAEGEREKLQMQLNQAQKMESVGRLAGGVAHDFNNMLGVILGYAELAMDQTEKDQPLYSALTEIQTAARRSADLTRQLLAFARKQTVVPEVLDLNAAVEGMLSMLRRLIGEDVDLVWQPGNHLGLVKIDPSQIDQILANLCVNARDAIGDNGKITVETNDVDIDGGYQARYADFLPGKYVLLAVSDNGNGMDEDTQRKLFEPFFTTKELGRGSGLGLATVYGIVKQNNGFINVYSELGLGTTFKIYLPRHATEEEHRLKKELIVPVARGRETILLVEDEPAILKMTAKMLEQLGYKVLKTDVPSEALDLARTHAGKIRLLMTDVVMPGINGRALVERILPTNPGLKCLFMSGYTSNVIAHHGVLDEGVLFIQKPFSKQDLAAKIREALDHDPDGEVG